MFELATASGLDLQQQLAASCPNVPVIFITASDDPHLRERALRAGCIAYFRKTAPGEEVLAAIRKAVGRNGAG